MQPFQGWTTCRGPTQGSSQARNPGLSDSIPLGESLWDWIKNLRYVIGPEFVGHAAIR